jgi:Rieske Fe-S protein
MRVHHGTVWVELKRTGTSVKALRLNCTHFGCEVPWYEEKQRYVCRCHDGVYDPEGRPIAGPPTRPLAAMPVRIEGGEVVLEG